MRKYTGYKGKLTNRCPKIVDLALKWCDSKTAWVDHVYEHFIGIYVSKELRREATNIALGIQNPKKPKFVFETTIHWENLTEEETKKWTYVKDWVNWFQKNHLDMQQYYKTYGREALISQYFPSLDEDTQEQLADYLINSFN